MKWNIGRLRERRHDKYLQKEVLNTIKIYTLQQWILKQEMASCQAKYTTQRGRLKVVWPAQCQSRINNNGIIFLFYGLIRRKEKKRYSCVGPKGMSTHQSTNIWPCLPALVPKHMGGTLLCSAAGPEPEHSCKCSNVLFMLKSLSSFQAVKLSILIW